MKYFIFDTETTGLDSQRHTIIQLGYILWDSEKDKRTAHCIQIKPLSNCDISPEALKINGLDYATLHLGKEPKVAYEELIQHLSLYVDKFNKKDKLIPVGYNVRFDLEFLRAWFLKVDPVNGKYFGSWFWTAAIDLFSLIPLQIPNFEELPDFKLETVARAAGLTVDSRATHNALYDVTVTEALFKHLTMEI